jgi:hypothetical protein
MIPHADGTLDGREICDPTERAEHDPGFLQPRRSN